MASSIGIIVAFIDRTFRCTIGLCSVHVVVLATGGTFEILYSITGIAVLRPQARHRWRWLKVKFRACTMKHTV